MTPQRYQRAKHLFVEASQLRGNERSAFIERAVGDDVELRELVEKLLVADADPDAPRDSDLVGGGARVLAAKIADDEQRNEGEGRPLTLCRKRGFPHVHHT